MKISVNLDNVKRKLSNESVRRGQYAFANQALADMNQFVPADEGILRQSATIDLDGKGINYNTPYAKAQFYGFVGKGAHRVYNYTTPGTSRRWDLRAKGMFMSDWIDAFKKGAEW